MMTVNYGFCVSPAVISPHDFQASKFVIVATVDVMHLGPKHSFPNTTVEETSVKKKCKNLRNYSFSPRCEASGQIKIRIGHKVINSHIST